MKKFFKYTIKVIGAYLAYAFFSFWIYPINTLLPFSNSWFIKAPVSGLSMVGSSVRSELIGLTITSKRTLYLISGYSVDRKITDDHYKNLFATNSVSFFQECDEHLKCEEIKVGSKFVVKEVFHLKHLGIGAFFNSDHNVFLLTDSAGRLIEMYDYLLDDFESK